MFSSRLPSLRYGVALLLGMAALLLGVILWAAREQDALHDLLLRRQLHSASEQLASAAGRIALDYGWWDEAHDRIVVARDTTWAEENIGEWLGRTAEATAAIALDGGNRAIFTWPAGTAADPVALAPLLVAARAARTDSSRLTTGFAVLDGRLRLVAASIIRPVEREGSDAVLILAWDVETHVLPRLRRITQIASLALDGPSGETAGGETAGGESAAATLSAGADGGTARLRWQPVRPGSHFLRHVLPVAGATFAVMALLGWLLWRKAQRHGARALRLEESRTRLLAAVGHDLRQPLQSLSLFAAVLESRLHDDEPRSVLGRITHAIDRMGQLLDAILSLARLDMGDIHPTREALALEPLLAAVTEEMRPQAQAKGLRLRAVGTSLWGESSAPLLTTILRNLVANAIRYTQSGRVVIGCRRRRHLVEIWVCDTGIGIPDGKRTLIFEEFYQLGNAERDARRGVGLGLAIVQRLCRALDHGMAVRSAVGRGSIFVVSLPAAPAGGGRRPNSAGG